MLVDSFVWIAQLRGQRTPATAKLRAEASRQRLLIGDLILLELLRGARNEDHAERIETALRRTATVRLLDAASAAHNYRTLQGLGITIRETADIFIGTFCIENRHTLLHDNRDFAPMEQHLGLMVA